MLVPRIKIGHLWYDMVYTDKEIVDGTSVLVGQCDSSKLTITIWTGRKESAMNCTILHEILHAIGFERDLDLTERQVNQLACGLSTFICDNPEVITCLSSAHGKSSGHSDG